MDRLKTKIEKRRERLLKRFYKDLDLMRMYLDNSQKSANIKWYIKFAIREIKFLPGEKFRK